MRLHASAPRRSRVRRGLTAVLLLPLLVVLAGCFRLDMGLTINENDTVDMSVEIADLTGMMSRADMPCSELEGMEGAPDEMDFAVEEIEEDGNVGCRMLATGAPLDEMAGSGAGVTIERVDDTFVFAFDGDDTSLGDTSQFEDMPAGMEPDVSISVTFPGDVIEADGEIDGSTVTWTGIAAFAAGGSATGEASASALGGSSSTVVWVILGIVVLLALAALIFLIAKRNKSKAGTAAAETAPYGAAPYGAAAGAHQPGQPEGGFGPAGQVPADPGAGYAGQQAPAYPSATAAADTPVQRPEGESFAPPQPAAPEPQDAPPHGADPAPDQPAADQPGDEEPPAGSSDQPR